MRALWFLWTRTLWGAIRRAARRPRTLLPALFLFLLLASQMAGYLDKNATGAAGVAPTFTRTDLLMGGPGAFVVALRGVFLLALFSTLVGALGESGLFFAQSDVDFLFPAPLSRRAVLLSKMATKYLGLLFPAVYLPLALGNAALTEAHVSPLRFLPGMAGAWLYLACVTNAAQVILLRRSDTEDDEHKTGRLWAKRILTVAIVVLIGFSLFAVTQALGRAGLFSLRTLLFRINSESFTRTFLPDAWASDLFLTAFRPWQTGDTLRLLGLIALALGSFAWLFARDRDFYESAMETSARRAKLAAAVQGGDAGTVITQMARDGKLAKGRTFQSFGGGARALLWKDFVAATRTPPRAWVQLGVIAVVPALLGGVFGRKNSDVNVLFWTFVFTLQMSPFFLLGLRDMLRRADISKALPISPMRLLGAELALSVLQLTLIGWFSLSVMVTLGMGRGPLTVVAFLALPTLAALLLVTQTAFILLYPQANDPAQTVIANLLSVMASTFALVPSVTIGLTLFILGASPLVLGVTVAGVNLLCAFVSLWVTSLLWQRFDPTD